MTLQALVENVVLSPPLILSNICHFSFPFQFHLTERHFKEVMQMGRLDFYRLPLWKQEQCIKSARLGHYKTSGNPLHMYPRCLSPE